MKTKPVWGSRSGDRAILGRSDARSGGGGKWSSRAVCGLLAAAALAAGGRALVAPPSVSARAPAPSGAASGPVTVEVTPDRPVLVKGGGESEVVLRIRVGGCTLPPDADGARLPLNLAVVIDRSGSMEGAKIEQARQAAALLVDRMNPSDVFSLVAYDNEVDVLVPPRRIEGNAEALKRAIRQLEPGGSTALYAGVEKGAAQLREYLSDRNVNRVILLSDGLANVGPSTPREISKLGRRLADEGIPVTTIGLGDDYSEAVLASLAEASDANYYYVRDVEKLAEVFGREFGELQRLVARDLVIEITFRDGVEPMGIIGREEEAGESAPATGSSGPRGAGRVTLNLRSLAGSQQRDFFVRCRVPAGVPGAADDEASKDDGKSLFSLADVRVRYADLLREGTPAATDPIRAVVAGTSDEVKAKAAVNREVQVAWQLLDINTQTDRAMKLAESGAVDAAQATIGRQRERLMQLQEAAPSAALGGVVAEDLELLDRYDSDLADGAVEKDTTKALHYRYYQRRNAKPVDPAE